MNKIIVALDGMGIEASLKLARKLQGKVWGFKVNDILINTGKLIVETLKSYGNVFADPKFYDIPNTVANGVTRLAEAGADLITVHASGGISMMKAAVTAAKEVNSTTKILAVTILTSYSNIEAQQVYGQQEGNYTDEQARTNLVMKLAELAKQADIRGIVCSPKEGEAVRSIFPGLIVLPAFRPPGTALNDQIHTGGYAEAKIADYIVVGRPITQALDPVTATDEINAGLFNTD